MSQQYTRRLKLTRREYEDVLSRMEQRCGFMPGKDIRIDERFDFPVADIPMRVEHPDGGTSAFLVFGRNISKNGISILHGGYLHPGSTCRIVLARVKGDPIVVTGEVRHCRLFAGSCHELGIRFQSEVDPGELVGSAREEVMAAAEDEAEEKFSGHVLVAEAFAPDHLLLEHHLSLYGLDVMIAETAGAVLDAVQLMKLDLLVIGLRLISQHGLRTIKKLREGGYAQPIILLMAEQDPDLEERALKAGANAVIHKPFDVTYLVAQIRVALGNCAIRTRLRSTEAGRPGMPPLIGKYVELVRRTADQVERTFAEGEWAELREYCYQLKGSGCGYGFQHVTVSAIGALRALDRGVELEATKEAIQTLLVTCRSLEHSPIINEAG